MGDQMNRSYDNIEYIPFPGKSYRVGYARLSGKWRIYRSGKGWYVRADDFTKAAGFGAFCSSTLAEVSAELRVR